MIPIKPLHDPKEINPLYTSASKSPHPGLFSCAIALCYFGPIYQLFEDSPRAAP